MEDHLGITKVGMGLATLVGTEIREDLIPGTTGTTNATIHTIPTTVCLSMGGGNLQLGQGLIQELAPLQLRICSTNRSKVGMGIDPSMATRATREDTEETMERGLLTVISGAAVVINDRHNSLSGAYTRLAAYSETHFVRCRASVPKSIIFQPVNLVHTIEPSHDMIVTSHIYTLSCPCAW